MINKIQKKDFDTLNINDKLNMLRVTLNVIIDEINVGEVHNNKVQVDRRQANTEDILIKTITAQAEKELLGGNL